MIKRAHLRFIAIATLFFGSPTLTLAATFQGPSQQPPSGNAPGVIWNTKGTSLQQSADWNISGNGYLGGDLYLTTGHAMRIDGAGSTNIQMGNWGGGTQKPFTNYINGDLQLTDFGASPGQRGRVQATEFCFNPGGVSDCISDWGSAGGAGFVLKTGDTMSGSLAVNKTYAGSVGNTSTFAVSASPALNTTFSEMNGVYSIVAPPNSANPASVMNGVKSMINQSGAATTLAQSAAVIGNNANTGASNDYAYGGNFFASVNNNGRINQEVSGVRGQFNATTDFNTINRALGVYGEALNLSPTKSPNYLYGVQGYAQGKSLIETAGVLGVNFVNNARTTPQMGVYGITNLSGAAGTATNAYGVRGQVTGGGGSATNAYGLHGSVVGVTATNRYGVYGDGGAGTGVYGNGTVNGVQGNGTSYGGFFTGSTYGISGNATYAGATFTGTTYGMLVNGTGVGVDVTVPASAGAQRGMHIHMPNKGDGIQIDSAARGMVINTIGLNSTGIQLNSDDTGLEIATNGTGVNNYAGRFQAPNVVGIAGYKDRAGIYGYSNVAGDAGGEFTNANTNKTVFIANGSYPIEAVNGSTSGNSQIFYVNNAGDVHSNGTVSGFYFHDRATPATKFNAWYTYTDAAGTMARLYSNQIGDMLKVNWVNGQIFNYANTASFNIASDERLKDIHGEYTKGLEVLSQINPIIFNYKKNNPQKIESTITHQGISAQELLKVLPEAVHMGEDGYLTVNNDPIIWASVNSIKQLKSENDELKSKVQSLEERLNKLEEKLK